MNIENSLKIFGLWLAACAIVYIVIALGLPALQKGLLFLGGFLP